MTAYYRALRRMVAKLAKSIDRDIGPLIYNLSADEMPVVQGINDASNMLGSELDAAFAGIWREWAELEKLSGPLAKKAMNTANNNQRREFVGSFKSAAGVDLGKIADPSSKVKGRLIDRGIDAAFVDAVNTNVALIKTIGPQYLEHVEKALYEGIRTGLDGHSLKQEVLKVNGQNYNRAKLIARDQMQKFNSALSNARQQSIGVTGYIWRTSQDDRVRETHAEKDGQRFDWNAPPSDTGHPGEDINCRCTAEPDLGSISPWVKDVIGS